MIKYERCAPERKTHETRLRKSAQDDRLLLVCETGEANS